MAAVPLNPGIIATGMLNGCFGGSASSYPTQQACGENGSGVSVENQFRRQRQTIDCASLIIVMRLTTMTTVFSLNQCQTRRKRKNAKP
jgi:hypothetical protein